MPPPPAASASDLRRVQLAGILLDSEVQGFRGLGVKGGEKGSFKGPFKGIYRDSIRGIGFRAYLEVHG